MRIADKSADSLFSTAITNNLNEEQIFGKFTEVPVCLQCSDGFKLDTGEVTCSAISGLADCQRATGG